MKKSDDRKIIFIDTNVFIACSLEEVDNLNLRILEDIKSGLDKKMFLVLPENIKQEIVFILKDKFNNLKQAVENNFTIKKLIEKNDKLSGFLKDPLEESKKTILKNIDEKKASIMKVLEIIFNHENTKKIIINNELMMSGLKRAVLIKAPFTDKNSYITHQDCLAVEALLSIIKKNRNWRKLNVIICTDDPDYFDDDEKTKLHKDIKEDLASKCNKASIYSNPVDMLNREFKEKYTQADKDNYIKASEMVYDPKIWLRGSEMASAAPAVSLAARSFDQRHMVLNSPVVSAFDMFQENYISKNAKYCPNCGMSIESFLPNYLTRQTYYDIPITPSMLVGDSNYFECPYCLIKLNIKK